MKIRCKKYSFPVSTTLFLLLVIAHVSPRQTHAECKEFKIVEYEDRVEAVCVGEPLTEAQKKANLEDEKRQEVEASRQRIEEQKQQKLSAATGKIQAEKDAEAERRKKTTKPVNPPPPANKNIINLQKF